MSIVFQTCDLCDAHKHDDSGAFRVLPPLFGHFGGLPQFAGSVVTVKCFEDNSLVKQLLDTPGQGRVLVVDGGGSVRRALVGGNLAAAAERNGWAGIAALGLMPMPTEKRGQGQQNVVLDIAGARVAPGDWLYADEDGIVLSSTAIHQA